MAGQRNREQNQPIRLTNDMLSSVEKFSGAVDEDFAAFVCSFDEVTAAMHITDENKALLLPLRLREYAHSTYESVAPHIRGNYNRTITELKRKFVCPEHFTTGLLMGRVQNTKESILSYAHALRMLRKQCCPDMDNQTLDGILRDVFANVVEFTKSTKCS